MAALIPAAPEPMMTTSASSSQWRTVAAAAGGAVAYVASVTAPAPMAPVRRKSRRVREVGRSLMSILPCAIFHSNYRRVQRRAGNFRPSSIAASNSYKHLLHPDESFDGYRGYHHARLPS